MMTKQDFLISIENAASELYSSNRAADVNHVLRVFGHGAKTIEDLSPSDYDVVFSELYQRVTDMED